MLKISHYLDFTEHTLERDHWLMHSFQMGKYSKEPLIICYTQLLAPWTLESNKVLKMTCVDIAIIGREEQVGAATDKLLVG